MSLNSRVSVYRLLSNSIRRVRWFAAYLIVFILLAIPVYRATGFSLSLATLTGGFFFSAAIVQICKLLLDRLSSLIVALFVIGLIVTVIGRAIPAQCGCIEDEGLLEWRIDTFTVSYSVVMGLWVALFKLPYTVRELLRVEGWGKLRLVYVGTLKPTAIVATFAFASFALTGYAVEKMIEDSSYALGVMLLLVPIAVVEFCRREVTEDL